MEKSQYEMICPECKGCGYVDISDSEGNKDALCPNCDGSGLIPNAAGVELINFIKRYL